VTASLAPLPPAAAATGGVLFARYAYPPNEQGYCGPADAQEVLADAAGGQDPRGTRARAAEFAGAWPYLQLIARANGLTDALDPRVVRGYWLGASSAEAVPLRTLADHVDERFRHRAGRGWDHLASALRPGAIPDHAFHVLAVSPWVGLLRGGVIEPARSVLEACCIRPGEVVSVEDEHALVRVPTLGWDGSTMALVGHEVRRLRWQRDGLGPMFDLQPLDAVSVHWDWVCERLHAATALELSARLRQRLASVRC
jgi:hypothetical protein